jgi:glutamyl-Q tRNA(Asp) synthetase
VIVTRFAPAPTGRLHLGHVVNAVYVWGVARAAGGRVLLRIENHDRQRSRKEHEQAILEDLDWLGFTWDGPVARQSERDAVYTTALDSLRARGLVYACECTRRDIGSSAGAGSVERTYPGTCAGKALPEGAGVGIRVRLSPAVERFDDIVKGHQEQRPFDQCGDLLVRDRDGNWTYQFAVTVDDWRQDISLVVRGEDLLASTGRQLQLARLLGRTTPPLFLHHPLVMKSPSQKLSKSDGDTSVRDLRARGWCAADVIGDAARRAGFTTARDAVTVEELATIPEVGRLVSRVTAQHAASQYVGR